MVTEIKRTSFQAKKHAKPMKNSVLPLSPVKNESRVILWYQKIVGIKYNTSCYLQNPNDQQSTHLHNLKHLLNSPRDCSKIFFSLCGYVETTDSMSLSRSLKQVRSMKYTSSALTKSFSQWPNKQTASQQCS